MNKIRKALAAIVLSLVTISVNAQQVNTMYFMENSPMRHTLNPAFQPLCSFYIGVPGLSNFQFGASSPFSVQDVRTLINTGNKDQFYNSLPSLLSFGESYNFTLLNFGFRNKNTYATFSVATKGETYVNVPKEMMFYMPLYGNVKDQNNFIPETGQSVFDWKNLGFNATSYTEVAVGLSEVLDEKWTVGGKLKFLYGHAHASVVANNLTYTASQEQFLLNGTSTLNYAGPTAPVDIKLLNPNYNPNDFVKSYGVSDYAQPTGVGIGADFGATFKPIDELVLSAAVTDFGFIRWNRNSVSNTYSINNYNYGGPVYTNAQVSKDIVDSIGNVLKNSTLSSVSNNPFVTYTTTKVNVGAEYSFANNMLSLGLLSRTLFRESIYEELTGSFNVRPIDWFNMAVSYSALNGRFSNLGASIGLRTWVLHWFVAADYIPLNWVKITNSSTGYTDLARITPLGVPYNTSAVNVAVGVNFVFGNNKDSDKDGVIDRKDKCPDTPLEARNKVDKKGCPLDTDGDGVPDFLDLCANTPTGVQVDSVGCPLDGDADGVPDYKDKCPNTPVASRALVDTLGCSLDTDKDGIFDYLDKCPNTPEGVLVDSIGCPLDGDHDGVPDYLDKCPGTPAEAIGMVDANGCPLDSDADGVPDYLDKCPNTPTEAIGFVDKNGCPIDSDDDGVADYLDKCPNTPAGARGYVDEKGCPIDTDKDGVADFMDKCPNTPVEAIGTVDANGCPKDTDGDGVADYLDKCPNTPSAAKGFVDEKGCPIDTDADGVADFEDNCPKVPGVASNKGCPEIKKEVKKLFQKALQGIQFETGKAVIKPASFAILDQIAKVLADNPSYLIDVRGHTDNVGNPESNMQLSERRAAAVHDYLVGKGISLKRLSSHGFGDTKPVASNKTPKGKALNRRVEFVVTFEETTFE
jgi:outer membrane protein OmpA-like peptidoglycan-associated protein